MFVFNNKTFVFLFVAIVLVNARSIKRQRKVKSSILPATLTKFGCPISLTDFSCNCNQIIDPCCSLNPCNCQNIIIDNLNYEIDYTSSYASAIKLPKCLSTIDQGIPVPAINLPAVFNVIDAPSCQCQNPLCQCQSLPVCQCQNPICQCQSLPVCQCQNPICQCQSLPICQCQNPQFCQCQSLPPCQNMPYLPIDACGCNRCGPVLDVLSPYDVTGSLVQISCLEPAISPYLIETSVCQPSVVRLPNCGQIPVELSCGCQRGCCGCQLAVPEMPCGLPGCGCQQTYNYQNVQACGCQMPGCGCQTQGCCCQNLPVCGCQTQGCCCQNMPVCNCQLPGCGCGKYLRQVTLQPPFL